MSGNINIDAMRSYTSGNDVLIKKLLQSFINNIPGQLDQLKDYALTNDINQLKEMAHKLKTPFKYIGVDDIANKLDKIEGHAEQMPVDTLLRDINWVVNVGSGCVEDARRLVNKI